LTDLPIEKVMEGKKIARVVTTRTPSFVIVFDDKGQQIPELQGRPEQCMARIYDLAPPGTVFEIRDGIDKRDNRLLWVSGGAVVGE